nr:hypothetical protein [Salmonella sp.]
MDNISACTEEYDEEWVTRQECPGKNTRIMAVTGINGDIRLNKALWMIAEQFRECKS